LVQYANSDSSRRNENSDVKKQLLILLVRFAAIVFKKSSYQIISKIGVRNMIANANGINIYYEKSGSGEPLILLHGNGQSHRVFNAAIKELCKSHTVYALDSRGHGKSTKVKKLNYMDMANDVAEFIENTIGKKVFVYGLSDGGIIGLLLAIHYPQLLSSVIVSGVNTTPDGLKPQKIILYKILKPLFPAKMELLLTQPSITKEQLKSIKIPIVVLAGEKDIIKKSHTQFIAENIPNSNLKILEGEGHTSYVKNNTKIAEIIEPYII